jgi:hypothetical protein
MRKLVVIVLVLLLAAGAAYVVAGFQTAPAVTFTKPGDFAGGAVPIEFQVASSTTPTVEIAFEQNGARHALPAVPAGTTDVKTVASAQTVPGLTPQAGPAKVVVTASRKVWGLRTVKTEVTRTFTIRLEKPRVSVVSTKHYINLGGSEMIVYRATPADVVSGVRVGTLEYPGFPIAGAKVEGLKIDGDPATLRAAFFALRYDQDVNAPMKLFARDVTGEEATADFDHLTFTKPFKKSTITLDDCLHQPCRSGRARQCRRLQAGWHRHRAIRRDQQRVAQEEQRDHSGAGRADLTRHVLGRRRVPAVCQYQG